MTAIILVTLHRGITIISNKIPAGMPYLTSIRIWINNVLRDKKGHEFLFM